MQLKKSSKPEVSKTQAHLAQSLMQNSGAMVDGDGAETSSQHSSAWQVPAWPSSFNLEAALDKAYLAAKQHVDDLLAPDDMYVSLEVQNGDIAGTVKRAHDDVAVKTYEGAELLRLYARNVRPKGIVADGTL